MAGKETAIFHTLQQVRACGKQANRLFRVISTVIPKVIPDSPV